MSTLFYLIIAITGLSLTGMLLLSPIAVKKKPVHESKPLNHDDLAQLLTKIQHLEMQMETIKAQQGLTAMAFLSAAMKTPQAAARNVTRVGVRYSLQEDEPIKYTNELHSLVNYKN